MARRAGPFAAAETCFTMNASIQDPTETVDTFTVDALSLKCWWMCDDVKKGKGSPYSITERMVPELIPVLGSQPAGDVSHKPGGRLPLLSARPAVTPATLNMAATNFAAWWTGWVWTVCLRLLPDIVATAIWIQVLLRLSPARLPLGYRAICAMM